MSKKIIISLVIFLLVLISALTISKQVKIDNNDENFIINNSDNASWNISTENLKHSWGWDID